MVAGRRHNGRSSQGYYGDSDKHKSMPGQRRSALAECCLCWHDKYAYTQVLCPLGINYAQTSRPLNLSEASPVREVLPDLGDTSALNDALGLGLIIRPE